MRGASVLFSILSPDPDWEDDFNHWYETHQMPVRLACEGFHSAQRYRDLDRPVYLGLFEIDQLNRLDSPEYEKIRSQPNATTAWMLGNSLTYERYTANEVSCAVSDDAGDDALEAGILRAVFFSVPDDREDDFNSWYEEEHIPALLKAPGWLMIRRFVIEDADPSPWSHLALQYVANEEALVSEQREAARDSDRYRSLSEEPWFRPGISVFEKFGDRATGGK